MEAWGKVGGGASFWLPCWNKTHELRLRIGKQSFQSCSTVERDFLLDPLVSLLSPAEEDDLMDAL